MSKVYRCDICDYSGNKFNYDRHIKSISHKKKSIGTNKMKKCFICNDDIDIINYDSHIVVCHNGVIDKLKSKHKEELIARENKIKDIMICSNKNNNEEQSNYVILHKINLRFMDIPYSFCKYSLPNDIRHSLYDYRLIIYRILNEFIREPYKFMAEYMASEYTNIPIENRNVWCIDIFDNTYVAYINNKTSVGEWRIINKEIIIEYIIVPILNHICSIIKTALYTTPMVHLLGYEEYKDIKEGKLNGSDSIISKMNMEISKVRINPSISEEDKNSKIEEINDIYEKKLSTSTYLSRYKESYDKLKKYYSIICNDDFKYQVLYELSKLLCLDKKYLE